MNVIIRRALLSGAIAVGCLLNVTSSSSQIDRWGYWENGVSESWWFSNSEFTKAEADTAIARWDKIGSLKLSEQEWGGDYSRGSDVHGTYLRWSPQNGFVLAHVDKCAARVMQVGYGRVRMNRDIVEFIPEFLKGSDRHGTMHHGSQPLSVMRFVPARFRGVQHLISPPKLPDFADFAAGLGQHNAGLSSGDWIEYGFYHRIDGVEQPSSPGDLPIFPPEYRRFVRNPIQATVLKVMSRKVKKSSTADGEPYYQSNSDVRIDVGSADGVKRKMVFRVVGSVADDTLEVLQVQKHSSLGRIVRDVDEDHADVYYEWKREANQQDVKRSPAIVPGWRLTTAPQ